MSRDLALVLTALTGGLVALRAPRPRRRGGGDRRSLAVGVVVDHPGCSASSASP